MIVRTIGFPTPEGLWIRRDLAGAGSRACAAAIDALAVLSGYLALFFLVALLTSVDASGSSRVVLGALVGGVPLVLALSNLALHFFGRGRTPGKAALRLRVISTDGGRATVGQLALRAALLPVDAFVPLPVPGFFGLTVIALSERGQRLGDLVAGTVVVAERELPRASEPFPKQRWSKLPSRTLALQSGLAARLDQDDLAFLRALLARRDWTPEDRRRVYVAAASHYAVRLQLGRFDDARLVLKELYLFLREARG